MPRMFKGAFNCCGIAALQGFYTPSQNTFKQLQRIFNDYKYEYKAWIGVTSPSNDQRKAEQVLRKVGAKIIAKVQNYEGDDPLNVWIIPNPNYKTRTKKVRKNILVIRTGGGTGKRGRGKPERGTVR